MLTAHIEEKTADYIPEYSKDSECPYVIFEINGHVGNQEWLKVSSDQDLPINNWWGRKAKKLENEAGTCEVVIDRDQVPDYAWKRIDEVLSIPNPPRFWAVGPSGYDNDVTWLVLRDHENRQFGVSLESLQWILPVHRNRHLGDAFFDIAIKRISGEQAPFLQGNIPLVILKIHSHKYEGIHHRNILMFDEHLSPKLHKY